jgi:Co/Zn/Cd efflux system component
VTALTNSVWPDVLVGLGIAAMNADAAKEVWEAARGEQRKAES